MQTIGTVTVVTPGLQLSGLVTTIASSATNDDFRIQVGVPGSTNASLTEGQEIRFGAADAVVTVNNSSAGVGQLVLQSGPGQSVMVSIPAGQQFSGSGLALGGVQFDPLAAGSTNVSATIPGFVATTAATGHVTVSP